ncbi:hypothetical protein PV-S19_0065 [Pacmanvirus S19]|nr:hypothetical protein PV-S19_0065 [Pacmanvirus S19]
MKCSVRKLCSDEDCAECFDRSFASLPQSEYLTENNRISARMLTKGSAIKLEFKCNLCNHIFKTCPNKITTRNSWCPYCGLIYLCDDNNCNICFERSFASCALSQYWSPDNEISPRQVFKGSNNKKYKFKCNVCHHIFYSPLLSISKNGCGCPYCVNKCICKVDECLDCLDKSLASHPIAQYWSDLNPCRPRDVMKGNQTKYKFNCPMCPHTYEITANHITSRNQNCPYCEKYSSKLCTDKNCNHCFVRSFASHPKSKFWSQKNNIIPRNVTKCNGKKFIFNCDICNNEFEIRINTITYCNSWCNCCTNKTEEKLYNWLIKKFATDKQLRFDWCKNPDTDKYLPFDFLLSEYKIIIELDGGQHFKQVSNWDSPEVITKKDIYKMNCAITQGYTVIRLLQDDVWRDKNNWQDKLLENIKIRDKPEKIFIANDDIYINHKQ